MPRTARWSRADLIDGEVIKRLSRRSTARWVATALREWLTIFAVMWACNLWPTPLLWVVAIVFIGSRQHALGVLVHDAAHYLASPSRRWNDWLANYLAAYPLFLPVQGYRTHHLEHHGLLETPTDPERLTIDAFPREFTFPMPASRLYWLMFRDLIGGSLVPMSKLIDYVWAVPPGTKTGHIVRMAAYHLVAAAAAAATGLIWTYLLLWVVPAFTSFTLFFRMRTAAEHSGIGRPEERYTRDAVDPLATTRTFLADPVTRYLFSPYNIAYHTEHHLYPSVPGYRLKELRECLLKSPRYAARAHVTRGLPGLIRELTAVEA
jgi:fatty acid desaturase